MSSTVMSLRYAMTRSWWRAEMPEASS